MIQINLQIFFQTQQSWIEALTGVLWLKKLIVSKNRNWSAMYTEKEENHWGVPSSPECSGLDPSVSSDIFVANVEADSLGCLSFPLFRFQFV